MSFTDEADLLEREIKSARASGLWCTVTFCGKITGDGGSSTCICKKSLTESISDLNL
jgi:hypothetical protein